MPRPLLAAIVALCALSPHAPAWAHFPWLATDDAGHALLFFSEGPAERDYRLPAAVAEARVEHLQADGASAVELEKVDAEGFVGLRSGVSYKSGLLQTAFRYGVYGGMLLDYSARHYASADALRDADPAPLKLDVRPELSASGLAVRVAFEGHPLEGATVTLASQGEDAPEAKTDAQGIAHLPRPERGLVGLLVGHTVKGVEGELDGVAYSGAAHYATVTFVNAQGPSHRADAPAATEEKPEPAKRPAMEDASAALPLLPEAVSSFGAAPCDGYLYVYSGHTGAEHDHSRENLARGFWRARLDGAGAWEALPGGTPLQGLALVAHGGRVVRVGGMTAVNGPDDPDNLYSVTEVASYDPAGHRWTALPNLPEPRSSHDAAVLGDTLYVVGGWTLAGGGQGEWLHTAWSLDLSDPRAAWQPVPAPPTPRRAAAAAAWRGKLVLLGGMSDGRKVSSAVEAYDPAAKAWTPLADLPGNEMRGFGAAACTVGGALYASAAEGVVYRLADDGAAWTPAGEFKTPRFFHRLAGDSSGGLLGLAGASMGDGHLRDAERVALKP